MTSLLLIQNEEGATALMLACQREELENVALLLDQGVSQTLLLDQRVSRPLVLDQGVSQSLVLDQGVS